MINSMNAKSSLLSAVLLLTLTGMSSAQSLLDLPELFGLSQPREQGNSVTVDYNVDFHYFFDLRSFDVSNNIFMSTKTISLARVSPSAVVRFDQGRTATHRLALGIDLTKDLGANPTDELEYSETEHDPSIINTGLMKDIFFYYNYTRHTKRGHLGFNAGIFPRTVLKGDYTRAIFADDVIYYDPNIEGITVQYTSPRFRMELTGDLMAKQGIDRIGIMTAYTSGEYRPFKWVGLGWSGLFTHVNGTYIFECNVDFALANPYIKFDFAPLLGMQEFYIKAAGIGSYHLDRKMYHFDQEDEKEYPHFPLGGEATLGIRHWGIGIEDTFYYGQNQYEYFGSVYANTKATVYADALYQGDEFYFTRRSVPVWYNRAEAYWQPLSNNYVRARVGAVGHFITPAGEIGPYVGLQAKATLLFNLDAFRHPSDNLFPGGKRNTRERRPRRASDGPLFSL